MKKLKVLMFSPFCYPPTGTAAIVNSKLAIAMLDNGWRVDVITSGNVPLEYLRYSSGDYAAWRPLEEHVYVITIPIPQKFTLQNALWKLYCFVTRPDYWIMDQWAKKATALGEKLIAENGYDLLVSRGNPYQGHLPALHLSRRYKLPWITYWNDAYPAQKYPPPYGEGADAKIPNRVSRILSEIADNAGWLTFPSERFKNYMCSYLSKNTDLLLKSTAIPPIALKRFTSKSFCKHSGFVIAHIGTIPWAADTAAFFEGVRMFLRDLDPPAPITFKIVGGQRSLDHVVRQINLHGLNSVFLIEKGRPYIDSLNSMREADVLLIIEAACKEGVFLPCKFGDYVQSGKPILSVSPAVSNMHDILSVYGGGVAVDVQSSISVAKGLGRLYAAWKAGKLNATYGSDRLFDQFGEERALQQYLEIFNRIKK